MVLNVPMDDDVVNALAGKRVSLEAPPALELEFMGRLAFDDVEAVLSPAGLTMAFELEPAEVQRIKEGQHLFLVHMHSQTGIIPFRFIFERADYEPEGEFIQLSDNGKQETDDSETRLQESDGSEKDR